MGISKKPTETEAETSDEFSGHVEKIRTLSHEVLGLCMTKSEPGEAVLALCAVLATVLASQSRTDEAKTVGREMVMATIDHYMDALEPLRKQLHTTQAALTEDQMKDLLEKFKGSKIVH